MGRWGNWKEDQQILYKDVVPAFGKRKAKDIKRRDIFLLFDRLLERGATVAANWTLAVIRRMFNFVVESNHPGQILQSSFQKKVHTSLEDIQVDRDIFMHEYNNERTNQGKHYKGRTPMQTFQDGRPLYQ